MVSVNSGIGLSLIFAGRLYPFVLTIYTLTMNLHFNNDDFTFVIIRWIFSLSSMITCIAM